MEHPVAADAVREKVRRVGQVDEKERPPRQRAIRC
jgi:hypothetical protein